MAAIDLERARKDTPGCESVMHFNNAGSSLPPAPVVEAQINHLRLEAKLGGYEAADEAHAAVERVYDAAATLVNAHRDEIAIIENATRAWDMAFYSIPFAPGDRILTAMAEYASNYIPFLQVARRTGAIVEAIPNDEHGQVSIDALRDMLDERVKLIAITHVPTNGGLVNPAAQIGAVAREAGILYLLDACQSVGQLPIDVDAIGCDMLSTTGRKYLRGPRGTGFLYVRREVIEQLEPVMLDLHAAQWTSRDEYVVRPDARRFENWETNYAAKIGLGRGDRLRARMGHRRHLGRVAPLAESLRARLSVDSRRDDHRPRGSSRGNCYVHGRGEAGGRHSRGARRTAINVTHTRTPSTRLDMEARGLIRDGSRVGPLLQQRGGDRALLRNRRARRALIGRVIDGATDRVHRRHAARRTGQSAAREQRRRRRRANVAFGRRCTRHMQSRPKQRSSTRVASRSCRD